MTKLRQLPLLTATWRPTIRIISTRNMLVLVAFTYGYLLLAVCLWTTQPLNGTHPQQHVSIPQKNTSSIFVHESSTRQTHLRFIKPPGDNITALTALPPPRERAPAFIIIGSQKGGTQALSAYLSQHSLIEMPTEYDEPHFFDLWWDNDKSPAENLNTYIDNFYDRDCRQSPCLAGESTPIYLYDTVVVPRIKETCPWGKFIILLRDPVSRAKSQHNMLVDHGSLDVTFEEHLERDFKWMKMVGLITNKNLTRREEDLAWKKYLSHPKWHLLMIGRGLYEIQLRSWFEHFDRSRFLVLMSHDLDVNREVTMKRVYNFLGIPYESLDLQERVHVRHYTTTVSREIETPLYDFYRPYNKRLESLLGPEWKDVFEKKD